MASLWFCVPAHGRLEIAQICLTQLRRTCDALEQEGVEATAVVIACDENLDTARDLGFGWINRDNRFVSRRFNDGIQFALDPAFNPRPADYVVPFGSDDWADYRLFVDLPKPNTMVGFQRMSFVREDGQEITVRDLRYIGGSGIRIYPRRLMEAVGYRPADEDRPRGCDTSILTNLTREHDHRLRVEHRHLHDRQLVDWKSPGEQLNSYDSLIRHRTANTAADPFVELAEFYPADLLERMRALYTNRLVLA
jgi:hypothetical protein